MAELREYQAFDAKDRNPKRTFFLRCRSGEVFHFKYPDVYLKRVSRDQTVMVIYYYSLNIILRGRNLGAVAYAMDGEFPPGLHEFDPAQDAAPASDAPFISFVDVRNRRDENTPQPDEKIAEKERETAH